MPDRATDCAPPPMASSTIESAPVRVPDAVGVNVTLMVQLAATARLAGQLLLCVKSPLAENEEILSESVPVLVRVTDCAPLAVPTS